MAEKNGKAGFREYLQNASSLLERRALLTRTQDDDVRDIDRECRYPIDISPEDYRKMYDREGVGHRLVTIYPDWCWSVNPTIFETEDPDQETPFEAAIKDAAEGLRGEKTRFKSKEEQGNKLFHYLHRADQMAGIGHFGVILLGLDDGRPLSEPAEPREGQKLIYIRILDESKARVAQYEADPNNPRYGMPLTYEVESGRPEGRILTEAQNTVHWTRIIHVAERLLEDEVFAAPKMEVHWNRLLDIKKVGGGSGEMFWRGAFPGFAFELDPDLIGDATIDVDDDEIRDAMWRYSESLQRYIAVMGLRTKMLAPTVVDPNPHLEAHYRQITVTEGIPFRIFMGSEQAHLASTQDIKTWLRKIRHRQENYVGPMLIAPVIDRLIDLGVLPEPEEYFIDWPEIEAPSEQDRASVLKLLVEAMAKYIQGNVDQLIPPFEFLTKFLHMPPEEAEQIIEAANELIEEKEAEQEEARQRFMEEQQQMGQEEEENANPEGAPDQSAS